MVRFVESTGERYRVLLEDPEGCWLISFDVPATPFFVPEAGMNGYQRIETPELFLEYWGRDKLSDAEQDRLGLIQPLLDD